jgi:hypothetical protein
MFYNYAIFMITWLYMIIIINFKLLCVPLTLFDHFSKLKHLDEGFIFVNWKLSTFILKKITCWYYILSLDAINFTMYYKLLCKIWCKMEFTKLNLNWINWYMIIFLNKYYIEFYNISFFLSLLLICYGVLKLFIFSNVAVWNFDKNFHILGFIKNFT